MTGVETDRLPEKAGGDADSWPLVFHEAILRGRPV
jgi:hypothetical protein